MLRPAGERGFEAVEAAVAAKLVELESLPQRLVAVVNAGDDAAGPYFTGAVVDPEFGARVEIDCDQFWGPGHDFDDEQRRRLAALGLALPEQSEPNVRVVLDVPVDRARLAALLVRPLEVIYGAHDTSPIGLLTCAGGPCRPLDAR